MRYPRSETIRKGWVLRQAGKLVIFVGLMGFIIEQYVNPTVRNSQHPLKGNYLQAVKRVWKLSMPVLHVWLCIIISILVQYTFCTVYSTIQRFVGVYKIAKLREDKTLYKCLYGNNHR